MKQMIAVKLDTSKIDKTKLFTGKNGAKYLDIILMESPNDKYGNDFMVVQSVTKQEREAGVRGAILGNGKIIGNARPATQPQEDSSDDLPF